MRLIIFIGLFIATNVCVIKAQNVTQIVGTFSCTLRNVTQRTTASFSCLKLSSDEDANWFFRNRTSTFWGASDIQLYDNGVLLDHLQIIIDQQYNYGGPVNLFSNPAVCDITEQQYLTWSNGYTFGSDQSHFHNISNENLLNVCNVTVEYYSFTCSFEDAGIRLEGSCVPVNLTNTGAVTLSQGFSSSSVTLIQALRDGSGGGTPWSVLERLHQPSVLTSSFTTSQNGTNSTGTGGGTLWDVVDHTHISTVPIPFDVLNNSYCIVSPYSSLLFSFYPDTPVNSGGYVTLPQNETNPTACSVTLFGNRQCPSPTVELTGGGTVNNTVRSLRQRTVKIQTSVDLHGCNATCSLIYTWTVYHLSSVQDTPSPDNQLSLPTSVRVNSAYLTIPGGNLPYGIIKIELHLNASVSPGANITQNVSSYNATWLDIEASALVAKIRGGSQKSIGFNTTMQLDGSRSYDPDGLLTSNTMRFTWFCSLQNEEVNVTYFKLHSHTPTKGCKGNGYQLPFEGHTIADANISTVALPVTYVFTLLVEGRGREPGTASQRVTVEPGNPPAIAVRCVQNCRALVKFNSKLALTATCTNCEGTSQVSYTWGFQALTANSQRTAVNWLTETTTGNHKANLVIKDQVFLSELQETYILSVNVSKADGTQGFAAYTIMTNPRPTLGQCNVDPSSGFVLQTKFTITCRDFQDEHTPLSYQFFLNTDDNTQTLLYFGYDSYSPEIYLPAGKATENYEVHIAVAVTDTYGATREVLTSATVQEQQVALK